MKSTRTSRSIVSCCERSEVVTECPQARFLFPADILPPCHTPVVSEAFSVVVEDCL